MGGLNYLTSSDTARLWLIDAIQSPHDEVPSRFSNASERITKDLDPTEKSRLEKELVWLQDPLKLAENTISLLKDNKSEKAIDIVRMASKNISCSVSWNHLIDYEMSKGSIHKAIKIYNEMKKRGQQPDAQTYTILLRGLSWNPNLQESLPQALKIYHSMFADNCPVKPNIIHTNTVLKVCALARDMDALWGVAAKLPTRGIGASNNLTFTIILNAIRANTWLRDQALPDEREEERNLRGQRAVMQGRRLWEEIIPRWRAGDIWIDEELVCSMGRLLLLGSTQRDCEDILSLAEQIMAVPRQLPPRFRDPEEFRGANDPPAVAPETARAEGSTTQRGLPLKWSPSEDGERTSAPQETSTISSPAVPEMTHALANVFQPEKSTPPNVSLARPGRNTLSLILQACVSLRAIPAAQKYWGLLTSPTGPYNITPDSENYHQYLRLLRVQRASTLAADLITDMHSGELKSQNILQYKTFRIALSCCVRNKNSISSVAQAQRIVEIMYRTLEYPDTPSLEMFTILLTTAGGIRTDYRPALAGLRVLEQGMLLLKNMVSFGLKDVQKETKREVVELARRVVAAYDFVLDVAGDNLVGPDRTWCMQTKKTWSAWAQKWRLLANAPRVENRRRRDEKREADAKGERGGRERKKEEEQPDEDKGTAWEGPNFGSQGAADGIRKLNHLQRSRRRQPAKDSSWVVGKFRGRAANVGGGQMTRTRGAMRRHEEFDFYGD
ncbi:MAG: hypothetical protein LQ346_005901 [Caloplaca aetnensis]|nr:MAG: hypothetical protein LQ346_005901 [Caloplaca aetnensis]